jgi:hypothetical protein
MSNFPNDEIPEELQKEVLRFVENIHPRSGKTMGEKLMAYEGLIGLANRDEYKCTLCSSKYQLLPMIRCIFECESDSSLIQRAIVVVWYLSRNFEAKVCICDPELGLLPLLLHRLSSNYPGNINLHNCICNCSMTDKVHGYLFTKQFHYLELCKKEFLRDRRNNLAVQSFFCAANRLHNENVFYFVEYNIPDFLLRILLNSSSRPEQWPDRFRGIHYWCLNFLMVFSCLENGRKALIQLPTIRDGIFFFRELIYSNKSERYKALLILANLLLELSQENSTADKNTFCFQLDLPVLSLNLVQLYPVAFDGLMRALVSTIFFGQQQLYESYFLSDASGFAYAILKLRDFSCAFLSLAVLSQSNRELMKSHPLFFIALKDILNRFVNNEEEYFRLYQITYEFAGGGKEDYETMEYLLQLLLELSYDYHLEKKEEDRMITELQWNGSPSLEELLLSLTKQHDVEGRFLPEKLICLKNLLLKKCSCEKSLSTRSQEKGERVWKKLKTWLG